MLKKAPQFFLLLLILKYWGNYLLCPFHIKNDSFASINLTKMKKKFPHRHIKERKRKAETKVQVIALYTLILKPIFYIYNLLIFLLYFKKIFFYKNIFIKFII